MWRLIESPDSNVTQMSRPASKSTLPGTKHTPLASYVLWWKKAYACKREAAISPERRGT
jgi:hypothetical protein